MTFSFLPELAYTFMLVFARLGAMISLMPGIGERSIPMRVRLVAALAITFVMFPVVAGTYGAVPETILAVILVLFGEVLVGLAIGLSARLIVSALTTAGTIISFQTGLAFAQNIDPSVGTQTAIFSSLLSVLGVVLVFALDLHHIAIAGVYDSFVLFRPGQPVPAGDFASVAVSLTAKAFSVAIQLSAPFIVFGLMFYLGLGVLSRLMPQIQIFFIAMPLNIGIGLMILAFLLATIMGWYINHLEEALTMFRVR